MTSLESDIREIKAKLDLLCEHLGIGQTRPADIIDIRDKAKRMAEKLSERRGATRSDERRRKSDVVATGSVKAR